MSRKPTLSESLQAIGLTELEADIYTFLVRESPASGYRIAQAIGRQIGNVYKAVEALEAKSAIISVDDDQTRLYRAIPPAEFLARRQRDFAAHCGAAAERLSRAAETPCDDRTYSLRDAEQFFARCRAMLQRAEVVVLATLCPTPWAHLCDALQAVSGRGIPTGVKVFESVPAGALEAIVDPRGITPVRDGPGHWMSLSVDGRESAFGLLTPEGELLHGVWSESALLGWLFFTGLSSDLLLAAVRGALQGGEGVDGLRKVMQRLKPLETPGTVGKRYLLQRYRDAIRPRARAAAEKRVQGSRK